MKRLYTAAIIFESILLLTDSQSYSEFKLGVIFYTLVFIAYYLDEINKNLKSPKK